MFFRSGDLRKLLAVVACDYLWDAVETENYLRQSWIKWEEAVNGNSI